MLDLSKVRYTLYAPSRQRRNTATRPIRVEGGTAYVPLTRGGVALIDAADLERVAGFSWSLFEGSRGGPYAKAKIAGRDVCLHRFLLDAAPGTQIDHENGDGLDCRRANIRFATYHQNNANRRAHRRNTSGYKGVSFDRRRRKWDARIRLDRRKHLGYFETAEAAAQAYDEAARRLFGEFARLNFPQPGEQPARVR